MTTYYFGINRGDRLENCAVGTSTTGKDIELTVNGANVPDKQAVLTHLQFLWDFVVEGNWTPL